MAVFVRPTLAQNEPLLVCWCLHERSMSEPGVLISQPCSALRCGLDQSAGLAGTKWCAAELALTLALQLDVAVLVLLLINVLAKGARPPAWLFWTMPAPSLTFAAVNAACLLLALLSPSW